jgi:hypothetical protein
VTASVVGARHHRAVLSPAACDDRRMPSQPVLMPARLYEAHSHWAARGRPPQRASQWSKEPWVRAFPEDKEFLRRLPETLSREDVVAQARDVSSPERARRVFLAVMAWGFGRVGYGPYRTQRILAAADDVEKRLYDVAQVARSQGGLAAFENIAARPLKYLGVAFGTKFVYFTSRAGNAGATPILDAVVRRWLREHTSLRPRLDRWSVEDYRSYVDALHSWAQGLEGPNATGVEELIFRDEINKDATSQWAEPALEHLEPAASAVDVDGDDVLDALETLGLGLAELTELDPADASDAEWHLRSLRRIVLSRIPGQATPNT